MPFHRRISAWLPVLAWTVPTAQASLADIAATAERASPYLAAGLGLGCRFQVLPFQCMISVVLGLAGLPVEPTAQALLAEVAATPRRVPLMAAAAEPAGADAARAAAAGGKGAMPTATQASSGMTTTGMAVTLTERVAS